MAMKSTDGSLMRFLDHHVGYQADTCLTWPFGKSANGYGSVRFRGKQTPAHRVMCILAHGEPPTPEYEAAHSCGNGHLGCVNPKHLRWATSVENQGDRVLHGTDMRGEKHHCAVLDETTVLSLRRTHEREAICFKRAAAEMGVDPATVRRAVLGITWNHI